MPFSKTKFPLEAYKKYRKEQSSKAYAAQLQSFAGRTLGRPRHVRPGPTHNASASTTATPFFLDRPLDLPSQTVFFDKGPPYSDGHPHPESTIKTGGTAQGVYYNIESLGDAVTGHLSVGINAGIIRNADWTGGTYYSNLPDRWLLGDCIKSSASMLQLVDLPKGLQPGTTLSTNVEFTWDPMYPSAAYISTQPNWFRQLYFDALSNTPGLPNSALGGFVGCTAMVTLDLLLLSPNGVISSSQAFHEILNLGINAQHYGDTVQDKVASDYLFFDFAFLNDPWTVINLLASVGYVKGANQLLVETTIRLAGVRGGINDPNAGYVTAAFMNLYKGASPVSFVPDRPNPFLIKRIKAFSTP